MIRCHEAKATDGALRAAIPPPAACANARPPEQEGSPWACGLDGWGLCIHADPRRRMSLPAGRCARFAARTESYHLTGGRQMNRHRRCPACGEPDHGEEPFGFCLKGR